GSISFADVETGDTHTASFAPQSGGYVGTFSLDPVTEASGSSSVGWHLTVDNSDIPLLSQRQRLTQVYIVTSPVDHGASVPQDVTIPINGTNDAPTGSADTIITDVDTGGFVSIPDWALVLNDSDPDSADTLSVSGTDGGSGGFAGHGGGSV